MSKRTKRQKFKATGSIISGDDLTRLIRKGRIVISPFTEDAISCKGIDLRLGSEIVHIRQTEMVFDSRKQNDLSSFYTKEVRSEFLIRTQKKVLLHTLERVALPADVMGIIGLRSSYSRLGLHAPLGFVDPGFEGQLTLEVTGSSFPIKVYTGDKLFHIVFAKLNSMCKNPYRGKYQKQKGAALPIFR